MYAHLNYIKAGNHRKQGQRSARGRRRPAKQQALETLVYNGCRPGKDQEELQREYFGHGGKLTPEQAMQMIREASSNTLFWRLILNPDPALEDPNRDLDLKDLTLEMVRWLERRIGREGQIPFVAAEHDDHTDLRHVHALLLIERRGFERLITKEIIEEFRLEAARRALERQGMHGPEILALLQNQAGQEQRRAPEPHPDQGGGTTTDAALPAARPTRPIVLAADHHRPEGREPVAATELVSPPCPSCGQGTLRRLPQSRVWQCTNCGLMMKNGQVLKKGRELEWSL